MLVIGCSEGPKQSFGEPLRACYWLLVRGEVLKGNGEDG